MHNLTYIVFQFLPCNIITKNMTYPLNQSSGNLLLPQCSSALYRHHSIFLHISCIFKCAMFFFSLSVLLGCHLNLPCVFSSFWIFIDAFLFFSQPFSCRDVSFFVIYICPWFDWCIFHLYSCPFLTLISFLAYKFVCEV